MGNSLILDELKHLEQIKDHEVLMIEILKTYIKCFPIKNAHLLRFSLIGYLGESIISINKKGEYESKFIREDVRSLHHIFSAINERKAKFFNDSHIAHLAFSSNKFFRNLKSLLVVPIISNGVVVGYICSNEFEQNFKVNSEFLGELTIFGQWVGDRLNNYQIAWNHKLSSREIEVMKLISEGENTREIALKLFISEPTVKQYVQSVLKKINARNRTHAVTLLIRKGVI